MAGGYGLTGTLAAAAATANQILWGAVSGATTSDGVLVDFEVTFDAAAGAAGIKVELFRATGGIPTNYAYTVDKLFGDSQTTSGLGTFWVCSGSNPVAASPTGLTVIRTWYVNPSGGLLKQWPLGREIYMPAGTTVWIGARISTPSGVSPNCSYNATWAE